MNESIQSTTPRECVEVACELLRIFCKMGVRGVFATHLVDKIVYPGERAALDALVPLIERSNRWARIENIEVTTLPVKEHEYGFGERSGE